MEQKNKKILLAALAVSLGALVLEFGLVRVSWALPIIKKPVEIPPGFSEVAEIQRCNNVKTIAAGKYGPVNVMINEDKDFYNDLISRLEDMSYNLSRLGYDVSSLRQSIFVFRAVKSQVDATGDEVYVLFKELKNDACNLTPGERKEKVGEIREKVNYLKDVRSSIKLEGWDILGGNINDLKDQR